MSDLSITAANVARVSGGVISGLLASATITAGQTVYLNSNDEWALAKADSAAHLGSGQGPIGIALHASLSGQPLEVQISGQITIGATVAVGTIYVVAADNAGAIAPFADLSTGNIVQVLGLAISTTVIDMTYATAYTNGYTGLAHA